jgi:integrase
MGQITESTIKNLKTPKHGNEVTWDGEIPGFGVRITAAGVKSFVLSYRIHGVKRRYTIGRCSEWSAKAARDEATELKKAIRNGQDPLSLKRQQSSEPTFNELTKQYLDEYAAKDKRPTSIRNDRQMINGLLIPRWSSIQIKAITKRDVDALHRSMKATPYRANRLLSLLSKMFNLAVEWGYRDDNPARGVEKYHEDRRERWLNKEELSRLDEALTKYSDQSAANAIRLLVLTGAREGEVLKADWTQFDLKRGTWTKPSHHTKQRKIEHVPLGELALNLLRKIKPKASGPLFPGADVGKARVTIRRPWVQVCKAAGLSDAIEMKGKRRKIIRYKPTVRIHDLRHTYASQLVSNGVSLQVIGRLLGHTNPQTTNRYAHVADEALRDAANRFAF